MKKVILSLGIVTALGLASCGNQKPSDVVIKAEEQVEAIADELFGDDEEGDEEGEDEAAE